MLNSIYGIMPEQLSAFLSSEYPAYRSQQLLKWIYEKKVFAVGSDAVGSWRRSRLARCRPG